MYLSINNVCVCVCITYNMSDGCFGYNDIFLLTLYNIIDTVSKRQSIPNECTVINEVTAPNECTTSIEDATSNEGIASIKGPTPY